MAYSGRHPWDANDPYPGDCPCGNSCPGEYCYADDRQCIACHYICSDERAWDATPFACPGCGRKGHWSNDVDYSLERVETCT
jgi:hypothetical protein